MKIINEDTLDDRLQAKMNQDAQQASQMLTNDEIVNMDDVDTTELMKELTRSWEANIRAERKGKGNFHSVLLVGRAGVGKTALVKQWCKAHGCNLKQYDVKTMDITDLRGVYTADMENNQTKNLPLGSFNPLDRPHSVLFLDEFNRTDARTRFTLANLINQHDLMDETQPDGTRHFPNLELCIAAINPPNENYAVDDQMDSAEMSRFKQFYVLPDKRDLLNYFTKRYTSEIEAEQEQYPEDAAEDAGRLAIATALLKNVEFEFSDDDDETRINMMPAGTASPTNPRSLETLLDECNGTKKDFLGLWSRFCDPEQLPTIKRLLNDYQDVDNKANSVFKKGSFTFGQKSNYNKIMDKYNELGL